MNFLKLFSSQADVWFFHNAEKLSKKKALPNQKMELTFFVKMVVWQQCQTTKFQREPEYNAGDLF